MGQIEEALKWYKTGAGKWKNMECAIRLLKYYSRVLGKEECANRTKALDAFGDLFSTWTFVQLETGIFCEEMMPLYTFAYAVELDVCQSGEWRGRQESIKYYRKTLLAEQGLQYWKKISEMAYGFLTANDTVEGILDISHGIDLLELLGEHLDRLADVYTHKTTYKDTIELFLKGYEKVLKENSDIVRRYKQEDYDIEKRYRIAKQKIEKNLASLEKGHKIPFPTWLIK